MALNTRTGLDPRWAFWGRDSLAGYMPATCIVFATEAKSVPTWTPFNTDPAQRQPGQINTNTKVYQGPCRVEQYKGFRARKGQDAVEDATDQAVLVQLALNRNTLAGFASPDSWPPIYPGYLVTVTKVAGIQGRAQSNAVTTFDYYVRIVDEASSDMTKDLFCDIVASSKGGPRGNIG